MVAIVRQLQERGEADELHDLCALLPSTYPSSVKLIGLMRNVDAVRKAHDEGRLALGTVKC